MKISDKQYNNLKKVGTSKTTVKYKTTTKNTYTTKLTERWRRYYQDGEQVDYKIWTYNKAYKKYKAVKTTEKVLDKVYPRENVQSEYYQDVLTYTTYKNSTKKTIKIVNKKTAPNHYQITKRVGTKKIPYYTTKTKKLYKIRFYFNKYGQLLNKKVIINNTKKYGKPYYTWTKVGKFHLATDGSLYPNGYLYGEYEVVKYDKEPVYMTVSKTGKNPIKVRVWRN